MPVSSSTPIPRPAHDYLNYGGHPDPTREDERQFVLHARWAVESWLKAAAATLPAEGEAVPSGEEKVTCWIRPAVDGMTIRFGGGRETGDDEYQDEQGLI